MRDARKDGEHDPEHAREPALLCQALVERSHVGEREIRIEREDLLADHRHHLRRVPARTDEDRPEPDDAGILRVGNIDDRIRLGIRPGRRSAA